MAAIKVGPRNITIVIDGARNRLDVTRFWNSLGRYLDEAIFSHWI